MEANTRRVALVTGASSGMGLVTARALASQGWHVITHGRDPTRTLAAEALIRDSASPAGRVDVLRADLSSMAEAADLAERVANLVSRLDLLINNAGGVAASKNITAEGNEATFAGNHLGHFLLADRLLPLLMAAAAESEPGSVRIVNVASSAHEFATGLDWNDLQSMNEFDPNSAYCRAKLANVLFTKELARRLDGTGIVVHAMHPGAVNTGFFSHGDAYMQEFGRTNPLVTAEQGADTIIWLATAPEAGGSTGKYWHERRRIPVSEFAEDPAAAECLWHESERLIAASRQVAG